MQKIKQTCFVLLLVSLFTYCKPESDLETSKTKIVATTGMVADLVSNIGKDSVEVESLMGAGVDPHLYKATQGDLSNLQAADIIFYNGLHLEGKMAEVFEKLAKVKMVVPIAQSIPEEYLLKDSNYEGVPDPHIWFDVAIWFHTIDIVLEKLIEKDAESESYYRKNAALYRKQLLRLDAFVKDEIKRIPKEKRILITAHDAFNYFGRAYDIEVKGLQGISTLSEFGLKDRVDLVNFIAERGIKSVFVETSVSEKNIKAIVEGARQKGHELQIGGNLYSDAMGAPNTPEGTYIGMVKANVKTIVEGLMD